MFCVLLLTQVLFFLHHFLYFLEINHQIDTMVLSVMVVVDLSSAVVFSLKLAEYLILYCAYCYLDLLDEEMDLVLVLVMVLVFERLPVEEVYWVLVCLLLMVDYLILCELVFVMEQLLLMVYSIMVH